MGLGANNPCRVFLSHTSEFRKYPSDRSYLAAVESAVSAAGHVIVDMREFAASDAAPAQVCQEKVRGCELYLGIFGTRYGSPVRDRPEVSYTELEFETASDPAHPLERLVFLLDQEAENPGIPAKWLNDPIHGASQQAFLRKVKDAGLTLQTFGNPDELARLVERSLAEWQQRERGRQAALAQSRQSTVVQTTRVPFMAPDLPIGFVQRPKQFEALRALLLEGERKDPVAITTALTGAGGFGKTTLAAALCHDEEIIQAFDDGILWTTLGETPDLADALAKLHAGLTGERPAFKDAEDAATSLAERLEGKNCLVVIDDVWDPAHLEPFLRGGPGCARLITSRLLQVATDVQAQRLLVDEMSASEAVAMLTARLPGPPPDPAPFQALAQALGEWPLLLRLAASAMAELVELGSSVAEALATILDDLAEGGITSWDRDSPSDRNAAVAQTLQLSLKRLTAAEQEHYKKLAVFPEDEPIPLPVAAQLWGLDGSNCRRLAVKLATASLLEFNPAAGLIRLHDVLRTFLGQTLGQAGLAQAHAGLIDSWGDPHQLPHPYAWRWIGYHLEAAGRQSQLDGLLLDCPWLQAKLNATGITALEREFNHASDQPALGRLRRVLRNASHVLATHPQQLPSQLLARLPSRSQNNAVKNLRRQSCGWLEKVGGALPLTECLQNSEALLRTFVTHGSAVDALVVFPDGRLASGSSDGSIRIWNPDTGDCKTNLKGLPKRIKCLAVLPDGRIAAGYWDGPIQIWNPDTGDCKATLKGLPKWIQCLAVFPDGRIAAGYWDGSIQILNLETGESEITLESPSKRIVECLAVLTDGRLASGYQGGSIYIWNPKTGIREDTLDNHRQFTVSCLVSLADSRLISGYEVIKIWDLSKRSNQILDEENASHGALAVLSDGRLATSSNWSSIQIWNLDKCICETTLESTKVSCLAALPDGRLASGSSYGHIRVWDMQADHNEVTNHGHSERIKSLALLKDGRVVSTAEEGKMKLWVPTEGTCEATIMGLSPASSTRNLTGLTVLPNGHIVCGGDRYSPRHCIVRVWNPTTGNCTATFEGPNDWAVCLVALPEGRFASASDDGTLQVWDVATERCTASLKGQQADVTALAILPSGQIAAASRDQKIRLWDPESPDSLRTLEVHPEIILDLAALPDGRLATADVNGLIRVWDPVTGVWHDLIKGSRCSTLISLRNGRLVTLSHLGSIGIWNPNTGACEITLESSSKEMANCLAVLTDGRLASGYGDGSIRIWNLETSICDVTLVGHSKYVSSLALLFDNRLVSHSGDNTIRVWDIEQQVCTTIFHCNHQDFLHLVALSDGRLACCSEKKISFTGVVSMSGMLRVWDHELKACIRTVQTSSIGVDNVTSLQDGRVAATSDAYTIRIWDTTRHSCTVIHEGNENGRENCLVAMSSGHLAHLQADQGIIQLIEPVTGECSRFIETFVHLNTFIAFPDGRLACGSYDGSIQIWNLDTGVCEITLESLSKEMVRCLAVLTGGRLASKHMDGSIQIWNLAMGVCEATLKGPSESYSGLAVLTDGRLAFGDQDGSIRIWDLDTGMCEITLKSPTKETLACLAVLTDGRLASGDQDGSIRIWDLDTGICEITLKSPTKQTVTSLAVLTDGRLASMCPYGSIRIWNLNTEVLETTLECPGTGLYVFPSLAALSDGRLAVASVKRTLRLWNLTKGTCEKTFESHSEYITCLATTPESHVISGSGSGTLQIWNPATPTCEYKFHAHSKPVECLAVFADGRIASGSSDGTIQVWDPEKPCSIRVLDEPMRKVTCLAVLADDSLLSAFDDGTIRVSTIRDGHWETMVLFVADTIISALIYSQKVGVIVAGDNSGCLHFLQFHGPSGE